MRFDFTDLNLFRHTVEAGSITHGAQRSNLALAAASTRIRKMELAFGTDLLVRGRAGVTPTQAGRTLLQHARGILAQTEKLQEDLSPSARAAAHEQGCAEGKLHLAEARGGGGERQIRALGAVGDAASLDRMAEQIQVGVVEAHGALSFLLCE